MMKFQKIIMVLVSLFTMGTMCFAGTLDSTSIPPTGTPNGNMIGSDINMAGHEIINAGDVRLDSSAPVNPQTPYSIATGQYVVNQLDSVKIIMLKKGNDEAHMIWKQYLDPRAASVCQFGAKKLQEVSTESSKYTDKVANNLKSQY